MVDIGPALLIVSGLIILGGQIYENGLQPLAKHLNPPDPEPSPIDEAHQAYYEGQIDEDELERRLEILVDDRAQTIRDMADDTDGVGEELSRDLAREFETVEDLVGADVDDLQEIDGIGEKKAKKLREQLD